VEATTNMKVFGDGAERMAKRCTRATLRGGAVGGGERAVWL